MSCTFWNMRRRKAILAHQAEVASATRASNSAVVENPVENVEKPTPRKKRGAAE